MLFAISHLEEVYLTPADSINVNNRLEDAGIGPPQDRRYHARLAHASTIRFSSVTVPETRAARTGGILQNDTYIDKLTRPTAYLKSTQLGRFQSSD
jgi:hypothetical protein